MMDFRWEGVPEPGIGAGGSSAMEKALSLPSPYQLGFQQGSHVEKAHLSPNDQSGWAGAGGGIRCSFGHSGHKPYKAL